MKRNYTDEELAKAVKGSKSWAEVLRNLSVRGGGAQAIARKKAKELGLDSSHFSGQAWSKGKSLKYRTPTKDYLSNKVKIHSYRLKIRLFAEGVFEKKCYSCNLTTWLGGEIPLELEHKDGNKFNNSLKNLTILCPNCHAKTDTYKIKNKGRYSVV